MDRWARLRGLDGATPGSVWSPVTRLSFLLEMPVPSRASMCAMCGQGGVDREDLGGTLCGVPGASATAVEGCCVRRGEQSCPAQGGACRARAGPPSQATSPAARVPLPPGARGSVGAAKQMQALWPLTRLWDWVGHTFPRLQRRRSDGEASWFPGEAGAHSTTRQESCWLSCRRGLSSAWEAANAPH